MSYELNIDPKRRAAGRFIGSVRKELIGAALDEKTNNRVTQQTIANRLGVNKSVISRLLRGESNLTLRTIAELAWALGYVPRLVLERRASVEGSNHAGEFVAGEAQNTPGTNRSLDNFDYRSAASATQSSSQSNMLEIAG